MKKLLLLLLIVGCEEGGLNTNSITNVTTVSDTLYVVNYDTTFIYDTLLVNNYDTLIITNYDTTFIYDTLIVLDTLVLEELDCNGIPGGSAQMDNCGNCDTDLSNDCIIENFSLAFDGIDDYIQLSSSIRVGTTPISIMFRAKTNNYSVTSSMDIIGQACDYGCNGDFRLQFSTFHCELEGVSFKSPAHYATFPFNVGDNKWHNYAFVFGENGDYSYSNMKVYVDGNEISSDCGHNWGGWNYNLPDIPMTIGKGINGHNYFSGYIYNIAVFSKSLTSEEVQEYIDYSFTGSENSLVGYWNFNEGFGINIFDLTGNENHGIINGANWTICNDNNNDCIQD